MIRKLSVRSVSMKFRGVTAVNNVSLEMNDNSQSLMIVGPNGAGKSTLFNMICGSLMPTSGEIYFEGIRLTNKKEYEFARHGIVRKFQNPAIFSELRVEDNLIVARESPRSYPGKIERGILDEMLERFQLTDVANMEAGKLPHGKKQWLDIAMTLCAGPKLILLDEPTAGMTAQETRATGDLLRSIATQTPMIVIEHDMSFVRMMGLRTIVLHRGSIIADGAFDEVEANDTVRDVYLGRG